MATQVIEVLKTLRKKAVSLDATVSKKDFIKNVQFGAYVPEGEE
jgi:hypothetical protein